MGSRVPPDYEFHMTSESISLSGALGVRLNISCGGFHKLRYRVLPATKKCMVADGGSFFLTSLRSFLPLNDQVGEIL